jgi:U3 small nucleolar RNA-associated protein 12
MTHVRPDKSGIVTCSADKTIKFWDFDLIPDRELASSGSSNAPNRLSLVAGQTIEMTDDVLSIKYSKDGKFLAASLLDTTVRVFFADSMKFFLSLYGHKVLHYTSYALIRLDRHALTLWSLAAPCNEFRHLR